jgi:hypothetical protein
MVKLTGLALSAREKHDLEREGQQSDALYRATLRGGDTASVGVVHGCRDTVTTSDIWCPLKMSA